MNWYELPSQFVLHNSVNNCDRVSKAQKTYSAFLSRNDSKNIREDPTTELVELWQPEGASYYNGKLILQPQQRWTPEQELELLEWHPMFTSRCPQCGYEFDRDYTSLVHWDRAECGWMIPFREISLNMPS
ncbi:hypothetical protein I8751_18045 [Nostocaceae cyanobacterium CENA357]|uniref:Uncharacterized protein n=1 Tax=Atlanticothrix silvestris CENA357 TaxID=1725252 RepID=A0A8J7L3Y2_9CYAN|nr:hypothetical protein [Atlanticothrix silvestris]MBH8554231.1 hypothetical protein [Atlanticothrix silvestris CENA357]